MTALRPHATAASLARSARRALVVLALLLGAAAPQGPAEAAEVSAAVLRVEEERPVPISRLDLPPEDEGVAGALLATKDNATTGRFLGHSHVLAESQTIAGEAAAELDSLIADGVGFVVLLAPAEVQLALADHVADKDVILFNASARDTRLRDADCRPNLFHTMASRAMLADGLAQYLVWKRWSDWVLVYGSHPEDELLAEAYRNAARKFGAEIVEERLFEDTGGGRISDSGHVLVQRQIPVFMQELEDHDVVVAADENAVFGVYLPYRTWEARPVVGSAGLVSTIWDPSHESFGATQAQRRFEKLAGRAMREVDYAAWLAIRAVGEAVTRTSSADVATVRDYLRSDEFELAGFTGQGLTFRPWNNQLRMGMKLTDRRLLVSISPQEEFFHQRTRLDTLGLDEPESACRF